jgi:hypothetical protein
MRRIPRKKKPDLLAAGLLVETGPEGHPARRLYARAGFKESGLPPLTADTDRGKVGTPSRTRRARSFT